jgi:hypothetical protein
MMLLTGLQSFLLKPCKSLNRGPKKYQDGIESGAMVSMRLH